MIVTLEHWFLNTATGTLYLSEDDAETEHSTLDHTPLELLMCLIRYQGQDVSKDTMLNEVWPNKVVSEDVLSVAVSQIRKALGDNARKPQFIKTIPSVGYRLIANTNKINHNNIEPTPTPLAASNIVNKPETKWHQLKLISSLLVLLTICLCGYFYWQGQKNITLEDFPSPAIIDQYQKARYLAEQDDEAGWTTAQQTFEDTIIKVPNYAPLYRELVSVKRKLLGWDNGKETLSAVEDFYYLLDMSFALAPNDIKTHLLKADIAFLSEWNFELANTHYKKALYIDSNSSDAHFAYSQFLLAAEEFELALFHIQQYINLDPNGYAVPSVAWVYNMMGDTERAIKELVKLKGLQPDTFGYYVSAQAILENMGDEVASANALFEILKLSHYSKEEMSAAKFAYQQNGLAGINRWFLDVKKESGYIGQYEPPLSFARYAITAGELDRAVDYIQQAFEKRDATLLWFNVDPKYIPIRNHPALENIINPQKFKINR